MVHKLGKNPTLVAQAVFDDVSRNDEVDRDLNPCMCCDNQCDLATGIETTLVAQTAHWFVEKMRTAGYAWDYSQCVYMPSRRAEAEAGFDLSLGYYSRRPRVRTMHKVVYGKHWCDTAWEWNTADGDWKHMVTLARVFNRRDELYPFLIIHTCFCVHEYRRMGQRLGDVPIPVFDSLLRTVVIDLGAITRQQMHALDEGRELVVIKKVVEQLERESPEDYLGRLASPDLFEAKITSEEGDIILPVISLSELGEFCVEHLQ